MSHDFSDPAAPSTRQSVIMKPDDETPGGLKVVRPAEAAAAAKSYTVEWSCLRGTAGGRHASRVPPAGVPCAGQLVYASSSESCAAGQPVLAVNVSRR